MQRRFSTRLRSSALTISLAFFAAAGAACKDDTVAPTETPASMTETFTGTLARDQASVHSFPVPTTGAVTLTLTGIEPVDEAITLTLAIGTWNGTACTVVAENKTAKLGTFVTGTALAGTFCVRLSDAGTIPESITYTLQVIHPA